MRTIQVSSGVFAKIWTLRRPGEETENQILERVLRCDPEQVPPSATAPVASKPSNDYLDERNGISLPENFEIYRTFKGREYRAVVKDGLWELDGKLYPSIAQLSWTVTSSNENAWKRWMYTDTGGAAKPIDTLRDPARVVHRKEVREMDLTPKGGR